MANKQTKWRTVGRTFSPIFRFTRVGQQLTGTFIGSRSIASTKYKGKETVFHEIDVDSGTFGIKSGKMSLVGGGQLNWLFKEAKLSGGEMVRVTYQGKAAVSKKWAKGKEPHQFMLEVEA